MGNLIEKGPGFHHLNVAVAEKLQGWIVQASEGYFQEQLELDPDHHDVKLAELGQAIGSLLAEVGHLDRSASALETAHAIREETNTLQTPDGANLLRSIGVTKAKQYDMEGALKDFEAAKRIRHETKTLETPDGARLLANI